MTTKEAHLSSTELVIRETAEPSVVGPGTDPVRDVLREAKGLCAARWGGAAGLGCINDHLMFVLERRRRQDLIVPALRALMGELGIPDGYVKDLYAWNDAPGRTHAEVVDLFDRALAAKGTR